jgi:hypothetical protein
MAPGWSSGSAGHVWLWALADEQFAEARFRTLAERAVLPIFGPTEPARQATSCQGQGYFGKRSFISGMTQRGGWPDATRWTLA